MQCLERLMWQVQVGSIWTLKPRGSDVDALRKAAINTQSTKQAQSVPLLNDVGLAIVAN